MLLLNSPVHDISHGEPAVIATTFRAKNLSAWCHGFAQCCDILRLSYAELTWSAAD